MEPPWTQHDQWAHELDANVQNKISKRRKGERRRVIQEIKMKKRKKGKKLNHVRDIVWSPTLALIMSSKTSLDQF